MKNSPLPNVPLAGLNLALAADGNGNKNHGSVTKQFSGYGMKLASNIAEPDELLKPSDDMPEEVKSEMGKLKGRLEATGHPLTELPNALAPLTVDSSIRPAMTRGGEGESGANSSFVRQGVVSDMRKLKAKLALQRHPLVGLPETLAPLLGAKGNRGWRRSLEETILALAPGDALKVAGVLAHDTAFKELNAMLRTAEVLADYFALDFKLIVTQWEQIAHPISDEVFKTIVHGIDSQLKLRFPRSELIAADRCATTASTPFVQAREEIWNRIEGTPCVEDLNWIISFYGRQNSYRPSGMAQALHDFTMRRGLGLLIEKIDPGLALLTERTDRLSRCYRCSCPVLNVKP